MFGFVLTVVVVVQLLLRPTVADAVNAAHDVSLLDLPANHLPYHLHGHPDTVSYVCASDAQCMQHLTDELGNRSATSTGAAASATATPCWGYELGCRRADRFAPPAHCTTDNFNEPASPASVAAGPSLALPRKVDTFYDQADFGYVREQARELITICEPQLVDDSSLECSPHLRFCRARGIRVDFRQLAGGRIDPFRYRTDVLAAGQIGGRCRLHADRLRGQLDHQSALQSWAPELQHFVALPRLQCDEIVSRPTFLLKIDAAFNMYHHFCDLFNMYASLHVNATHAAAFGTDVQLLVWETYPYRSPFAAAWRAFSRHPLQTLTDVRGRVVCYRNLVLPLLPRMIFGLYYNTPIVKNCANSGLFQAFSEHMLHRMRVPLQRPPADGRLRITLLLRLTKYRNVVNADELVARLAQDPRYAVQTVSFERLAFVDQLAITRNTDVFVGMHGAGLTHLLFLPRWASLFELYNCNDESCYRDLARLRGVNYVTWQRPDKLHRVSPPPVADGDSGDRQQQPNEAGGNNDKFMNFRFDGAEFERLVDLAAELVRGHDDYRAFVRGGGREGIGERVGSGHQSDEL